MSELQNPIGFETALNKPDLAESENLSLRQHWINKVMIKGDEEVLLPHQPAAPKAESVKRPRCALRTLDVQSAVSETSTVTGPPPKKPRTGTVKQVGYFGEKWRLCCAAVNSTTGEKCRKIANHEADGLCKCWAYEGYKRSDDYKYSYTPQL